MSANPHEQEKCGECGVDRGFYQKHNRRLREKLEYTELQLHDLVRECEQLREALRIAKWQAQSSIIPTHEPPNLPNELLREIFAMATSINDLAFSPWNIEERGRSWNLSSSTRKSIPLVCRQWNAVGTEFLYERLVLSRPSQVIRLINFLDTLRGDRRKQHLSWIRGLELTLGPVSKRGAIQYWRETLNLAGLLPPNRLKVFAMDSLEYVDSEALISAESTAKFAFQYFKNSLEILHIPVVYHPLDWDFFAQVDIEPREVESLTPAYFPRLHTISTTLGRWELCPPRRNQSGPFRILKGHVPVLRSLSLDWPTDVADVIRFLGASPQLERVHVGDTGKSYFIATHLDAFLYTLPRLKHLTVTTSDRNIRAIVTNPNYLFHRELEEIILLMNYAISYKIISSLWGLFDKVKSGKLPGLRRIILYGPFFGGCLDGTLVFPPQYFTLWKDAIDVCARQGVELVNTHGDTIHLWNVRNGIKVDGHRLGSESKEHPNPIKEQEQDTSDQDEETSDEYDTVSSGSEEDDQWYEEEGSDYIFNTSDGGEVSNDSEDRPYRYVSQPDLGYRSDSSSDSAVSSE